MDRKIQAYIETAGMAEIDEILEAAAQRKKAIHPEWDMLYMSWDRKALQEKREVLEFAWKILEREESELRYKNTDSAL